MIPKIHYQISCYGAALAQLGLSDSEIIEIGKSASGEDTYLSRLRERISNWHFFPDEFYMLQFPYPRPVGGPLGTSHVATSTIEHIEESLLDLRCTRKTMLSNLGRALHFIQDATIPGHVVPIYHGPNIPGYGREIQHLKPNISDPVDCAPVSNLTPLETSDILNEIRFPSSSMQVCFSIQSVIQFNIQCILNLLKEKLDPTHPILGQYDWTYFFRGPRPEEFFGTYGVDQHGRQLFDPSRCQAVVEHAQMRIQVPKERIDRFIHNIHLLGIKTSAVFLMKRCRQTYPHFFKMEHQTTKT